MRVAETPHNGAACPKSRHEVSRGSPFARPSGPEGYKPSVPTALATSIGLSLGILSGKERPSVVKTNYFAVIADGLKAVPGHMIRCGAMAASLSSAGDSIY